MTIFGFCADCDATRELDRHARCWNCGSAATTGRTSKFVQQMPSENKFIGQLEAAVQSVEGGK
jgi:hypothetical protein